MTIKSNLIRLLERRWRSAYTKLKLASSLLLLLLFIIIIELLDDKLTGLPYYYRIIIIELLDDIQTLLSY